MNISEARDKIVEILKQEEDNLSDGFSWYCGVTREMTADEARETVDNHLGRMANRILTVIVSIDLDDSDEVKRNPGCTEENKKRIQAYLDNLRDTLDSLAVQEDSYGFFISIDGKKWRPQEEERTDPWIMTGRKEYQEKIDKIQRLEEEVAAQVVLIDAYVAKAEQQGEDTKTIVMPVDELHKKGKEIAQLRHRITREIQLRSRAHLEIEEYKREIIGMRKTLNNLRAEQAKRELDEDIDDS